MCICFCKQKTAYEMRISDWSSDVCSSDLSSKAASRNATSQSNGSSQRVDESVIINLLCERHIMNTPAIHSAGIEIMLGLPHLREGPLLARARALRQPVLVSANAFSRWSRRSGVREWAGWSTGQLRNAWGLHGLS